MPLPHFVKAEYTLENRVAPGAAALLVVVKKFPAKEFAASLRPTSKNTTSVIENRRMGILIVIFSGVITVLGISF